MFTDNNSVRLFTDGNEKFNALDDGHATERVLARIFNESEEQF